MIIKAQGKYRSLLQESQVKQSKCEGQLGNQFKLLKIEPIQGKPITDKNYKCICFLFAQQKNKLQQIGTAFLIKGNYCLTAAHNLFYYLNNKIYQIKDIYVYPALNQYIYYPKEIDKNNFIKVINRRCPEEYKQFGQKDKNKNKYDFAVLQLETSIIYDQYLALLVSKDDVNLIKKQCIVSGYPGKLSCMDQHGKYLTQQYYDKGKIQNIKDNIIQHTADTQSGQSGSPILFKVKNQFYVVGIHNYYSSKQKRNSGVFLSEQYVAMIALWIQQMAWNLTLNRFQGQDVKMESCSNFLENTQWAPENALLIKQDQSVDVKQKVIMELQKNFFDFNWIINDITRKNIKINGKKLTKIKNSYDQNQNGVVFSQEQIPKDCCTYIKVTNLGINDLVMIGLAKKKVGLQQENKITKDYFLKNCRWIFSIISNQKFQFSKIQENDLKLQSINLDKNKLMSGQSIGIQLNYPTKTIKFYKNDEMIIEQKLPDITLYLCAYMQKQGDCIIFNQTQQMLNKK